MAEDLDDGEFWLPSQFLTDDDILMDFSPSNKGSLGFGSDLDLPSNGSVTGSTETESDEDELLAELTRQMARSVIPSDCAVHSKGWTLSSSPQSTLCGCVGKEGSSLDSPNGPVSPTPSTDRDGGATLDLLNKAAGEVARMKMNGEKSSSRGGTGFFDCSSKRPICPPPRSTAPNAPLFAPYQFPPLNHGQQQLRQQRLINSQINILRNKSNNSNNNRPLGLPPSAWPPLQAQNQPTPRVPSMFVGQPWPKRESVGTGVFLPRRVASPIETRNKPEGVNTTKTRNGKGSNSQQHRRSGSRPPTANQTAIRLPPEWTY